MRAHLENQLHQLRSSLWFLPVTGVLLAMLLSWITISLDRAGMGFWLQHWLDLYPIGRSGARLILSTIAGSMMTIASLVFSMTVLTLTVASQQMGPRLLEWFMGDRVNQALMSYFVSLFVFALLAIGATGSTGQSDTLEAGASYVSVVTAIVLTVVGIIALIIFVHRTAKSIQTDSAISRTAAQLLTAIRESLTIRTRRAAADVHARE